MDTSTPAQRLAAALDMHDTGVALMRRNLERRHPEESAAGIDERLRAWLHDRPGAEHGDGPQPPDGS